MYGKPEESAAAYAKFAEIDLADALETGKFYSADMHAVASVRGLDEVMKQALESKFIDKPMTRAQVDEMIDLVYGQRRCGLTLAGIGCSGTAEH